MSYGATEAAWAYIRNPDNATMTAHEVVVLLDLADRENDKTRRLDPGHSRIAHDCHCSVPTVKRALTALTLRGVLTRTPGNGSRTTKYRLNLDRKATRPTDTGVTQTPGHTDPPGGSEGYPPGNLSDLSPGSDRATNQEGTVEFKPGAEATPEVLCSQCRDEQTTNPEGVCGQCLVRNMSKRLRGKDVL